MKQISYLMLKNYFENLCSNAKFLNSFVGYFSREFADKINTVEGLQDPSLVLFKYNLNFEGEEQNSLAIRPVGFGILFNNIASDDLEAQYNAIDVAEALAIKVLSRIRHDSFDQSHILYNSFIKNSVNIEPLELSANCFGVEVTLSLKNKQLLQVHQEDWEDIPHECL